MQYIGSKTGDDGSIYAARQGRVYACYYCCMPSSPVMLYIQGSKNISIKMLKDVGMTVPKGRDEGMQQ